MILSYGNTDLDLTEDRIQKYVSEGRHEEILLLVPTNRKLRFTKKSFVKDSPNSSANQVNVETLGTLTQKLLGEAQNFTTISEGAQSVLIKQSTEKVKFRYFTNNRELPVGTLDKIKNVISEYKRHGLTPDLLRAESKKLDKTELAKANDIADIFEEYQMRSDTLRAYETGDIYREVKNIGEEKLRDSFNSLFPKVKIIYLEGFSEFTRLETDILVRIGELEGIKLLVELDYFKYNHHLFGHLRDCYENLEKRGFVQASTEDKANDGYFANIVRSKLFTDSDHKKTEKFQDKITTIQASNREQEIVVIASEIKRILLESDVEPSDICVGFNVIKNYSSLIRDKFSSFGIPFNLTDRIQLDNSFSVAAVVNLLEIAENDFYHKSLFRGITNQFIDLPNINFGRLRHICSELKIISGYESWEQKLKSTINRIDKGYTEDYKFNSDFYKQGLQDLTTLSGLLKPFYKKLTISQFLKEVEELIIKAGIPKKILTIGGEKAEENIKGLTTFLETISEVFYLMEASQSSEEEYPLSYFMEQVRTACKWARFNVKEKSSYGVLVTSLDEIRGLDFKYLFIPGMSDGEFPTRYQPEIFFSGSFRKKELTHIQEERYRFYQALQTWKEKLYLSYPLNDSKSELRLSTFLKDFNKLFSTSELSITDFNDEIYTAENFMIECDPDEVSQENISNVVSRDYGEFIQANDVLSKRYLGSETSALFNGVLKPTADETLLSDYLLKDDYVNKLKNIQERLFSISQLENYAACPFKYFMDSVLRIKPYEDPTEDIEAIEFGNLVHLVLYRFHIWLRDENHDLRNIEENIFQTIRNKLFDIASEELEAMNFNSESSFYEIEKLFGLAGDSEKGILSQYLEEERNMESFMPAYFEVTFGRQRGNLSDDRIGSEDPIEINGVKMQGKIDRIEISDDRKHYNIVDYKTGSRIVKKTEIEEGLALQFPVYLHAAKELLKNDYSEDISPLHMFIYSLKYSKNVFGKNQVSLTRKKDANYKELNEEIIDKAGQYIEAYVKNMSEGKFNLSELENRKEKVCKYCGFNSICREIESGK